MTSALIKELYRLAAEVGRSKTVKVVGALWEALAPLATIKDLLQARIIGTLLVDVGAKERKRR